MVLLVLPSCVDSFVLHTRYSVAKHLHAGKGFAPVPNTKKALEKIPTREPKESVPCGCGSGNTYSSCCGRFHSGEATVNSALDVLRSRFTAYKYRLPEYLIRTSLKFQKDQVDNTVPLSKKLSEAKVAEKKEKEELLKFIDSYEFDDLTVGAVTEVSNCKTRRELL